MSDDREGLQFDAGFALPDLAAGRSLEAGRLYDVLVLGAGPAGLSASIYLMRKGLDAAVLTGDIGGQVAWTSAIENYLGYRLVEGAQLVEKFSEQLRDFNLSLALNEEARSVAAGEGSFEVSTAAGTYRSKTLILATGKRPRMLQVPGEKELLGRGVAFCAICDAPLYRGKVTAVVGGGNSGLEAAVDLAAVCPRVYLFERLGGLTGDAVLVDRVKGLGNVVVRTGVEVSEVLGTGKVEGVRVRRTDTGGTEEIAVEGVFVEIGLDPNSEPFRGFVDLNGWGEVKVDCACRTSRPGVFAAGDVTAVPYKQIIIAAGDGAKAALSAYEYLLREKAPATEEGR